MRIRFVLISEGSSDNSLVSHLEAVCIHVGADEAAGIAFDRQRLGPIGSKVADKLRAAMTLEPRYEIKKVVQHCTLKEARVAVVPIQETEAWLLLDTTAIRRVASRLKGTQPLGLPTAHTVEATRNPKELLQSAIVTAADVTGRKLEKLKKDFPTQRQILLQGLSVNGPQREIPSWQRMVEDLRKALGVMN